MKTDRLIDRLAGNVTALPKAAAVHMLARGFGGGALISFLVMLSWLGIRDGFSDAAVTSVYWMKFTYTLGFAILAFWLVERLSRPGVRAVLQAGLGTLPFAAIAVAAQLEWTAAADEDQIALLMGESSIACSWRIAALAMPVLAGALWSMRKLAPTRPALAGGAAGILAGAAGAWIYSFACNESSAVFVAVWYTAGIALAGFTGALAGRWALRW
jgi:hypothetical protein